MRDTCDCCINIKHLFGTGTFDEHYTILTGPSGMCLVRKFMMGFFGGLSETVMMDQRLSSSIHREHYIFLTDTPHAKNFRLK